MDLHSERLEAKLNAVDWAVRDVLVGTMRSLQQLDICRKDCFYYIPAERLQDSDFPVRYVALYQSQYVFGPQAGVRYYGEVTKCSAVRRSAITEVSPGEGRKKTLLPLRHPGMEAAEPAHRGQRNGLCKGFYQPVPAGAQCPDAGTLAPHGRGIPPLFGPEAGHLGRHHQRTGQRPCIRIPGLHRELCGGKNFRFRRRPRFCAV